MCQKKNNKTFSLPKTHDSEESIIKSFQEHDTEKYLIWTAVKLTEIKLMELKNAPDFSV